MLHHAYDKMTRYNTIGNNTQNYLLPTLAVGPPHNLLGYPVSKTVHLWFGHWILCWNPLSDPLLFPLLKVQNFQNPEHEE